MQHTKHHQHPSSSAPSRPTCLTRPHTANEISETVDTFKNLARQTQYHCTTIHRLRLWRSSKVLLQLRCPVQKYPVNLGWLFIMRAVPSLNPNSICLRVVLLHPGCTAWANPWVQVTPQKKHGHLVVKLVEQLVDTGTAPCYARVTTNDSVKHFCCIRLLCCSDDGPD